MKGRVLVVAGSDSGGGAGIQADIKTITALGGYAATAVTALTAQNTLGVFDIIETPPAFIVRQMELMLDDIGADAVKSGMIKGAGAIEAVAACLKARAGAVPLVVDPVMVAKGGSRLQDEAALGALVGGLLPMAHLLTPNLPEAEALTGMAIASTGDMAEAGRALLAMGARAVLVKGGHLPGETVTDLLVDEGGITLYAAPRMEGVALHGTGCTLASAIAVGLAQGLVLPAAIERARHYLRQAMLLAPGYGRGHGPLNHAWPVEPD